MASDQREIVHRPTLSFLATLAFATSFLLVRTFTTFYPDVVVVSGVIHFHHFWYGLAMIASAGWLGIAWRSSDRLNRIYAILYGLGAGLIGDEVGLLLTLGDYRSELTFQFFIGAVSLATLAILSLRYGDHLKRDIFGLGRGERLTYLGIFIAGISSIFFAFALLIPAIIVVSLGVALTIIGIGHRRRVSRRSGFILKGS